MMENNDISKRFKQVSPHQDLYNLLNEVPVKSNKINRNLNILSDQKKKLAEILVITSYPPRVCGIASYSQDLVKSLNLKFNKSFSINICALNSGKADYILQLLQSIQNLQL
jgi:hypothetical protein